MSNLITGFFFIGLNVYRGHSMFKGQAVGADYLLDVLGICFILYGIFRFFSPAQHS